MGHSISYRTLFDGTTSCMPSAASLLLKTLVMLEGTARLLSPTFSLNEVIAPFKDQLIRSRLDPKRWTRRLHQSMRDIDRLVRNGPGNIADILDRAQSGKLQMSHEVDHLELVANRLVGGMLTASLFMGSAMLLSHKVPPLAFGESILGGLGSPGGSRRRSSHALANQERHKVSVFYRSTKAKA